MKILSFQSAVAYGHVGNSAAIFALQRLGLEACPVDTVQFSNHPGYGAWRGGAHPAQALRDVVDGLEAAGLLEAFGAVLSGYLGLAETGDVVADAVRRLRGIHPAALYVCDPVMGDEGGGLYVAEGIPRVFAEVLAPLADIVTPNCFELGVLAGRPIGTTEDAIWAARRLMERGTKAVVATSLPAGDGMIGCLAVNAEGAWIVRTPRLRFPTPPNGGGDTLSALLLAHLIKGRDLPEALSMAVSSLYGVLEKTRAAGGRELALVAGQDEIAIPTRFFPPLPVKG
ncbi:pyridoxal kinase 2/pyridoxine kinase(Pyridoxal phosphate (active vitamin B6) biosynthesis, pyridoxal kinase,2-274) [Magnetospirillum sp. XM-1]|uniref:pyridoxal kinase PdxY n=1 Tax=Magnetospirillum sp. XM-1 TaxID=1663591 RepID=UPI00073DFA34|nr:pyridoxal kinase PdxY [Magnetospirillum sp. XM-1]CUW38476.1 pyridoxal kinase 2/pyridoxine kinase(Pyridoxal phosphate (active vitamin B6) biosynthesis, pyridoxal kinase,2-274) [Magnetospirillum sp. XM-1]